MSGRSFNRTRNMALCALFTALTCAGAFIQIPIPVAPFTLQFLFTTLAGLLLGKKLGALSVAAYVALGLAGLPVFAGGGGLSYVLRPSFGYVIGFAAGAYVSGAIAGEEAHPGRARLLLAGFAGLGVVYACGMSYYYWISNFYLGAPIGLWPLFLYCFLLAVPGDIALCLLSALLAGRLSPIIKRNGM